MQEKIGMGNIKKIKEKLKQYKKEDIEYNQPHVDEKCDMYQMSRRDFERHLLNPEKLNFVGIQKSKNPEYDKIYALYFAVSKSTTYLIPVGMKAKSL